MKTVLIMPFMLLTLAACQGSVQSIEPEEARTLLENDDDTVLLDVRTVEEYEDEHIPGAMLIPLSVLSDQVEEKIPDMETTILVYCRSGNRSLDAIEILESLGYEDVHDLGGIIDWPYETTRGS